LLELTYSPDHEVLFVSRFDEGGETSVEIIGHSMTILPVVLGDFDWQKELFAVECSDPLEGWQTICRAFMWSVVQLKDELELSIDGKAVHQDLFTVMSEVGESVTIQLDELEFRRSSSLIRAVYFDAEWASRNGFVQAV
jgi:hypothetical protein